jgi:hypothetical protein
MCRNDRNAACDQASHNNLASSFFENLVNLIPDLNQRDQKLAFYLTPTGMRLSWHAR